MPHKLSISAKGRNPSTQSHSAPSLRGVTINDLRLFFENDLKFLEQFELA